jgi:hypothetical protein
MKHIKLLALAAVLLPSLGHASNVIATNFGTGANAATSNPIIFSGAVAPAGAGIVAVGLFGAGDAAADAAITAAAGNPAAWATVAGTFSQFGASATVGSGAGAAPGTAGLFSVTPGQAVLAGSPFDGKNVYVAIGNAATLAGSSQVVVFKSTSTFALDPTPSVNAFLRDAAVGQDPAGTFLLGALGPGQVWYQTGPLAGQTITGVIGAVIIPEPATALLGMLSLGFGLVRRRR